MERELVAEISARFAQHLQKLVIPLEDQLAVFEQAKKGMAVRSQSLETIINTVSQERVKATENILATVKVLPLLKVGQEKTI